MMYIAYFSSLFYDTMSLILTSIPISFKKKCDICLQELRLNDVDNVEKMWTNGHAIISIGEDPSLNFYGFFKFNCCHM